MKYKVESIAHTNDFKNTALLEYLNEQAKEGWELISVCKDSLGLNTYFFKFNIDLLKID